LRERIGAGDSGGEPPGYDQSAPYTHGQLMNAPLVEPGQGELVTDEQQRTARIKADRDELVVTESRYAVGERGPDRHVHREHCDCFWVLVGELAFEVGAGEQLRAPAGAFVLVPPLVVHTFGNEGPGEARFLNVHAPGQGFADHLRAQQEGSDGEDVERFDTFDPPPDGGRPASEAVVRLPGDGERISMGSSSIVFKAQQEDARGALALMETTVGPGFPGPVLHRHRSTVDSFYVLDEPLALELDGEAVRAEPGSYVVIPPGLAHTFSNPSQRPVRFLSLMAPAGLEQYLTEAAAATPPGGPPDPQAMAAIASRYDFEPAA
jgi:quercetin dioxygenase-like cupin family protein